ncbi:MAG: GNAT family N-acetyltransferase [Muribaculaceae bacterium]|nr:GNAT family N-acetyltransferase [Muribaculaceae bacterium]MDE6754030.1 GNAT family N-acetyltransferase [Muribaculaceae bacterium]
MKEIIIKDATSGDSELIADAIIGAIGEEIAKKMAGDSNTLKDVHQVFSNLASRQNTQYSFKNTRIAFSEEGIPMGVCISYNGKDLKKLRYSFFTEANKILGWNVTAEEIDKLPPETDAEEYYLDTLMTLPDYRGRGVGESLIKDAAAKSRLNNKPLGLLCDPDNKNARRLYDKIGFKEVGIRPFAGHDMNHLLLVSHCL